MRRVKTWAAWDNGVSGRGMLHLDLRLMLAVVRAAEEAKQRSTVFTSGSEMRLNVHSWNILADAVDAFNKPRKQK